MRCHDAMASRYWLPAAFCLYVDTFFYQRHCVCLYELRVKTDFRGRKLECMALLCIRYRKTMAKYYWSFIVAFSMTMFVVLYYCFNENALTDDSSNTNLKVFESISFVERPIYSTDSASKHTDEKEMTSTCRQLHETASDMLYNGEKAPLPFETNSTRWTFHRRGNLDYLKSITRRWTKPFGEDLKSLQFTDYNSTKSKDIKAKKYFITFACNCCKKSKERAIKSAKFPGGFDFTTVHDLDSLSRKFKHAYSGILRQKRGCGYWLWKPYIILKTLVENMSDDDLVMYQDAGAYLIGDAGPLLKLSYDSDAGIVLFHTDFLEQVFTKRDAFILMDMDEKTVYESYQRLASFVIVRKNCKSLQFVMEWLAYASDPRILTDMDNKMGKKDLAAFKENRHDQTVLSLLSKRWQLPEFRDPSQYGNVDQKVMNVLGPYRQLIFHSRDTS